MVDPLQRLVASSTELDREMLATVLADMAWIDKDTGEIRLTREAVQMSKKLQILIYLMARKAAKALGLISEEGISPSELTSTLGMSGGTVRGQLFILSKERLINSSGGKYWVPNYAIELAKASLQQSTRKEK